MSRFSEPAAFLEPAILETVSSALPHFDAVPLFQLLKPEERRLLAPLCRAVPYEKGEDVFRERPCSGSPRARSSRRSTRRIARLLLTLAVRGKAADGRIAIPLALSRQDEAALRQVAYGDAG